MQITIIGGGSYQWTPELLADLLGTQSLRGARIVLEDIDPDPLEKMEALAGMVNESLGAGAIFPTTTDQRQALDGADFVIVTVSTGGFESMAVDLDVPAASVSASRWVTRSVPGASTARFATSPSWSAWPRTWGRSAPMPGCSTSPIR